MTTRPLTRRGALLLGTGALAACGLSTEATAKVSYLAPKASEAFANSPYRQVTDAEWKTRLTPAAYQVLRHEDTERPFTSPLTDEQRAGTFACAGCHLPLFKSDWIFHRTLASFASGFGHRRHRYSPAEPTIDSSR